VSLVERIWYDDKLAPTLARAALTPLAGLYGWAMSARTRLYDAGVLRTEQSALPVISVGNLSVGGTRKTPVAAWLAHRLSRRARPAIVLRGYGSDEPEVHRRLNPDIPVHVNADRAAAVRRAKEEGADVIVLDDAFQHRRLSRSADVVLVSVEQLLRPRRLLPAGPWRERLEAARRADLLLLTRKSAPAGDVARVTEMLRVAAPGVPIAAVHLAPAELVDTRSGTTLPIERLAGSLVVAIAAVGEPRLFAEQLAARGASVQLRAFRDHHAFTDDDARSLAAGVPPEAIAVCTLKDAVKLGGKWPGPSRLWYVSQQLVVEQGADVLERLLDRVLEARANTSITAG
jgi:tetraacyldisaccharide 4'-kinase